MACCGQGPHIGTLAEHPIVLGVPSGEPAEYRLLVSLFGLPWNSVAWVTGDQIDDYINGGLLAPLEVP